MLSCPTLLRSWHCVQRQSKRGRYQKHSSAKREERRPLLIKKERSKGEPKVESGGMFGMNKLPLAFVRWHWQIEFWDGERERHLSLMHNEIKVMEMNMFFEVQWAHSELKLSAFDKTRVEAVSHCVIFKYRVGRCCCHLSEPLYASIDQSCYQMFNYWLRCSWLDGLIDRFFNSSYTVSFITVELM